MKDKERLKKKREELERNLRNKVEKLKKFETDKVELGIQKENNKLEIRKCKETDITQKRIKLHERDITQIQGTIANMFLKIGSQQDEINRIKERQRRTNETIAEFNSKSKQASAEIVKYEENIIRIISSD